MSVYEIHTLHISQEKVLLICIPLSEMKDFVNHYFNEIHLKYKMLKIME
jgi:hypothetical protein